MLEKIMKTFSIKWMIIYGIVSPFFTAIAFLYILGVARYITDFEENTCEMTYMFEYPQYVRISLDSDIKEKYPRFGLYAYGEGYVTEKLRRMHFSGIPVLFIPGNAGSHEQVRSIASVSLRKSIRDRIPYHFDFFAVSFNKDYSAFYGGVLMEQTTYVSHCIKAILALYKNKVDSVVLIGHSMGGIIAKGALVLTPNVNASYASMIINLATPSTPALVLDRIFANYYRELENRLHEIKDAGVKVVSIGGGPRDILVTAAQTYDRTADINVLSTSVPAVWKSTDHLSILWCKQLVFPIVRSLFDSVEYSKKPPRITSDPDVKMQSLSYHFQQHNSGKRLYHHKEKIQFEADSEWVNITDQQYVWHNNKIGSRKSSAIYLAMELSRTESDSVTIDTIDLENRDWLFVCAASEPASKVRDQRICEWGWNLTNKTRILPDPLYRLRKSIDLRLKDIDYLNVTHVVVRIVADDFDNHLAVNFDSYFYNSRVVSTKNRFLQLKHFFGLRETNLIESVKGSVRYYVTLPDIMDAVTVHLKVPTCTNLKHYAIVELLEPWNPGSTQSRFFTNTDDSPKTMKMQTLYGRRNETAILRLTLDPTCIYGINIQPAGPVDKISCRIRDRWPLLYITIISLLILFVSLRLHSGSDTLPTVAVTIILSFVFRVTYETCIALCIIGVSAIGVCCSVIFLGSVAHGVAVRFLARAITFSTTWSDWVLNGLTQLPFVTAVFVVSLIPATCGGLAMLISVFLYYLRLTRMYEDYLEGILLTPLQHFNWFKRLRSARHEEDDRSASQEIYNHLILFLLWSFAAIPAVPSVLVWAKNFSYDMRLTTEDPALLTCWTILSACGILGIAQISPIEETRTREVVLSYALRLVSWIVLSMSAAPRPFFYHWYMPPVTTALVTLITLNTLIP
ncbi:hypothetical protein DMN91_009837 [Ooceraea biroi]|uniref:GPI inositol-deacylase n=1 Tax=Ooceraea biroi TaxID=2015173 RepID=A0A026WKA5_OOCBI|nr:GPI inositol-deacylase [Ooceraea biroi]EZA56408.1 GPI inositol-deacylase [Ooceraea biroi]RLU17601.1 hypothetical protein DMN91_009837 [Ooceraea biroi]